MVEVVLVKTKTCVYCPTASRLWNELQKEFKFTYREVDAMSPEGQKIVEKHMIMSVPTTVVDGKVAFLGIPEKSRAIAAVKK